MKKTSRTIAVLNSIIATLALLIVAGSLEAANCRTRYRIWQDGENTYFKHGETIVMTVGEKADLYIHAYPSGGEHPYSAAADIGSANAFGVGGRQDVSRYLRLADHQPAKGKVSLRAVGAGKTALGYHITGVASPGSLSAVPKDCRTGRINITVQNQRQQQQTRRVPEPPIQPVSANDAAHQLIVQLYTGILRRSASAAENYPNGYFDQVQRGGLQGLISIAETMTSSPEFRNQSLARTSEALARSGVSTRGLGRAVLENQLLTDMFTSLYGPGSEPYADARRRMASYLSGCITGPGTDSCRRLGRDLLTQPQYQNRNRNLLQYLR